ncbi:MAG: sigma-70 family RNA polymerase sigma factor [Phycisphaerales bacterium]|nr:sigma-70 family RNA polymerase sigma factor [Phycisphaerales bacterium]
MGVIEYTFPEMNPAQASVAPLEFGLSESLLQQVAAGNTEAVAACVDRFGGLVWSIARRFLDSPSEAEDAVQEVFIELWKNASRFDPSIASETTFVGMVARRRLIDRQRRNARRHDHGAVPIEDLPIAAPDHQGQIELRDEAAVAAEVLEQLKPEQRSVLQLAVYHGWPHQLIADRLGIPLGTVKTHVRRGLMKVREKLNARRSGGGAG